MYGFEIVLWGEAFAIGILPLVASEIILGAGSKSSAWPLQKGKEICLLVNAKSLYKLSF